MKAAACLSLLAFAQIALGHGGHEHTPADGETNQQYAQRHMSSEHHIDTFDLRSFFQLHDLNRDGFWDRDEIEAIYGIHHIYSQKKSKDEVEHKAKADHIVNTVLKLIDLNQDGRVTPEEFETAGLDGLPNFDSMGAEGHHYDVESEFFLHHEEQFHSTPETQTDESYNHPEDLEHFAHHEDIEFKEAEKEAKFQGLSVEEVLRSHEHVDTPPPSGRQNVDLPNEDIVPSHLQQPEDPDKPIAASKPKITRETAPEKQEPSVKFKGAKAEGEKMGEWGTGDAGYKPPKGPSDKMRKNLPYKYKFRRNWGDF